MNDSGTYTRRSFFKTLGILALGFLLVLWYRLVGHFITDNSPAGYAKVDLTQKVDGVYFYDSFIVNKKDGRVSIFNNRCTHAGCKINREHEGELICSCHGSVYDASTGIVKKGPAMKPLARMNYTGVPADGEIVIKL